MAKNKKQKARAAATRAERQRDLDNVANGWLGNEAFRTDDGAGVPMVLAPSTYKALETLCSDALRYSGNQIGVRQAVLGVLWAMRAEAGAKFGHDTADISGIAAILKRTAEDAARRPAEKDPIQELRRQRHLNAEQMNAALFIRAIWTAWSRYLSATPRAYKSKEHSISKNVRALDPVAVMGPTLINDWVNIYNPWYATAKKNLLPRLNSGMVSAAKLVLHMVLEPAYPGETDRFEQLERGVALRTLKTELSALARAYERRRELHGENDTQEDRALVGGGR